MPLGATGHVVLRDMLVRWQSSSLITSRAGAQMINQLPIGSRVSTTPAQIRWRAMSGFPIARR